MKSCKGKKLARKVLCEGKASFRQASGRLRFPGNNHRGKYSNIVGPRLLLFSFPLRRILFSLSLKMKTLTPSRNRHRHRNRSLLVRNDFNTPRSIQKNRCMSRDATPLNVLTPLNFGNVSTAKRRRRSSAKKSVRATPGKENVATPSRNIIVSKSGGLCSRKRKGLSVNVSLKATPKPLHLGGKVRPVSRESIWYVIVYSLHFTYFSIQLCNI